MANNWFAQYYSKQEVRSLFLIAAFLPHIWAFILFFWDFSWIKEWAGIQNAIGVGAYALVIAAIESLFLLLVSLLLGFLIPQVWTKKERASIMSLTILILSSWVILGQIYYLYTPNLRWLTLMMASSSNPVIWSNLVLSVIVTISFLVPIWFVLNSENFRRVLDILVERVSVLTTLYLMFDVISIIIVALRNNFWLPL